MTDRSTPFEILVHMTVELLPEVAQDLRRYVSDMNLLRAGALEALDGYPSQEFSALMIDLIARHDAVVEKELATLLVSLHDVDDVVELGYLGNRNHLHGVRYRFEGGTGDYKKPEWVTRSSSPQRYVRTIIAEAVARHLVAVGGWQRPARLARSRRS